MSRQESFKLSRRDMLRLSLMTGAGTLVGGQAWANICTQDGYWTDPTLPLDTGCGTGIEQMPFSPLVLDPFTEPLPVPTALRPGYRAPGYLTNSSYPELFDLAGGAWPVRMYGGVAGNFTSTPGPGAGNQDALGDRPNSKGYTGIPNAGTHQLWPGGGPTAAYYAREVGASTTPILYHIRLTMGPWRPTNKKVQPLQVALVTNKNGIKVKAVVPGPLPAGASDSGNPLTTFGDGTCLLPNSAVYGFNGTFPGPRINTMYGRPIVVRFENDLDYNCFGLDRQDFGAPDYAFLTHLHNGHTAPECDGQPFHMTDNDGGYRPMEWCDNLYLMYPAGNDDTEKQSFLWFHDHRMHHTGPNVYKGMVGLMPHHDPVLDSGDETTGLRLPGVKTLNFDSAGNPDGSFDVDYDIPMALYDWAADDGVTQHFDDHQALSGACGATHPEWWGKSFHKHYPNHGFVGDIFTINGKAVPFLQVRRRRYRFRFLGASISRIYELSLMTIPTGGGIDAVPGQQGQYNFVSQGKQVKKGAVRSRGVLIPNAWIQVASEGGLLQFATPRDFIQIWPAKRREVVVDFGALYNAGIKKLYLANTMFMPDGRKPLFPGDKGFDPAYCVPMMEIRISDDNSGFTDDSVMPAAGQVLRPMPTPVANPATLRNQSFTLTRGGATSESQWVINLQQFDPLNPLAVVDQGVPETWTVINGGGGWVHPMHMHMEEHQVLSRVGSTNQHPEDGPPPIGKEDVVALDPSESVTFYRNFRTFKGHYVAHCHNLAHEDHNMMFGWTIK